MIAFRPVEPGKRGSNIPTAVIDTAMARHPDGFGVAWRQNGVLKSEKFGPREGRAFRKALKRLDADAKLEYVAHFRYATHGPKARSHSHPYEYMDPDPKVGRVLVFHNGVIDIPTTSAESDTEVFVRDVLALLPSRWWTNSALRYLVGESIAWSRLVVMTAAETVNLQEDDGNWDGGLWYSSNHRPNATYTSQVYKAHKVPTGSAKGKVRSQRPYESAFGQVLDDDEAADKWAADKWVASNYGAQVGRRNDWEHGGHALTLMVEKIDRTVDGDIPEAFICDACYTVGDAYVVGGKVFIDMAHRFGPAAEEVDAYEDTDARAMLDGEDPDDLDACLLPESRIRAIGIVPLSGEDSADDYMERVASRRAHEDAKARALVAVN